MKILWFVNIPMPDVTKALNLPRVEGGGWISGQLDMLKSYLDVQVCHVTPKVKKFVQIEANGVKYFLIPQRKRSQISDFLKIIQTENPDLVHVFGTEYIVNCEIIKICPVPCVVSVQGIIAECAKHYMDGLPEKFKRVNIIRKIMRKLYYSDSIVLAQRDFMSRGGCEKEALKVAKNIIGRTGWDKAYAKNVAPQSNYFHVNENLRATFYDGEKWEYSKCQKYSIFVSQGHYPIKGLHMLLQVLPRILKEYPDTKIYVGGQKPYSVNNAFLDKGVDFFFEYQRYIKDLIKQNNLQKIICYTGPLNAEEMKRRYLDSNLFLSPSTIENSPNSVGEAMILGVPIVASNVGGVASLIDSEIDGKLYNFFSSEQMFECIKMIFENPERALKFGMNASDHARRTHDREENTVALLKAYKTIIK